MVMELRIDGVTVADRPLSPRPDDEAQAGELLGWAVFLDGDGMSADGDLREARALAEAADFDLNLLRRAWRLGLDRLGDGATTRNVVDLIYGALGVVGGVTAGPRVSCGHSADIAAALPQDGFVAGARSSSDAVRVPAMTSRATPASRRFRFRA